MFGDKTAGVGLAKPSSGSSVYSFTVIINSDDLVSSIGTFQIKIVNEAYQSDYTYTEAKVLSKTGEASIPATSASATSDMTFKGIIPVATGTTSAKPVESEITFSKGALNTATGNGANAVTLKTEMLEPSGSVAKISLKLNNAASSDFGTNYVTVSLSIPGNYTGLDVVYSGSGDPPIFLGCNYDSTKNVTIVTFKTNHFSEFSVVGNAKSTATVSDMDSLITALRADVPSVTLAAHIKYTMPNKSESKIYVGNDTMQVLDLNGYSLTVLSETEVPETNFSLFYVDGNFTMKGDGVVTTTGGNCTYCLYGFDVMAGGHLTIDGGTYMCGGTVVQMESDAGTKKSGFNMDCSCDINGGNFTVAPFDDPYGYKFMLNYIDALYKEAVAAGKQLMNVYGGIFINYDPSDSASEDPRGSFLGDSCCVRSSTYGDGTAYEVVPAVAKIGKSCYATIDDALSAVNDGDVIVLKPGVYSVAGKSMTNGITVTVQGESKESTSLEITSTGYQSTLSHSNLNFKNLTLNYANADYSGVQHSGAMTYENCNIKGMMTLYANSESFKDCIFTQDGNEGSYCVKTYGAKKVQFDNCNFTTFSRAVLLYTEDKSLNQDVIFNSCSFTATNPVAGKAAVEIHTELGPIYDVKMTSCSQNGFMGGSVSSDPMWNETGGKTSKVTIDGTVRWDKGPMTA